MNEQKMLAEKTGDDRFLNESVVGTLRLCFMTKQVQKAEQLRQKYGVNEKKFWYCQLRALCQMGDWDGVDRLGGAGAHKRRVRSPIGFLPFVDELAQRERIQQAAEYVAKLPELVERVEWYVKLECFKEAVDDAYNEEAVDLLLQIRRKATNQSTLQYIDSRIKQLQ